MSGTFETLKRSAICSGMLAPAISSTTARKKKKRKYRNRPKITVQLNAAIR